MIKFSNKKRLQFLGLVIIIMLLMYWLYNMYTFAEGVVNDAKNRKIFEGQELVIRVIDENFVELKTTNNYL